jgi:hypothetical protein
LQKATLSHCNIHGKQLLGYGKMVAPDMLPPKR